MAKKTNIVENTTPAPVVAAAAAPAVVKAPRTKKPKAPKAAEPVVEEEVVEEVVADEAAKPVDDADAKPKENLVDLVDECVTLLDVEIEAKPANAKALRTLKKKIAALRSKVSKVTKKKSSTKAPSTNTNSGFLKPVKISEEMAKFAGWSADVPKSRVDVTKYICNYIKENNLQNPEDRRQIVADPSLKKLLNFDPAKDGTLTYYKVQSFLKPHFIKPVDATASISA